MIETPIYELGSLHGNNLYVKREDFIPFSFGGNKARKAELFFDEISRLKSDSVVTYGSNSSNHCRIVANECARRKLNCYIISPKEEYTTTFNSQMISLFGAETIIVPLDDVHATIENTIAKLKSEGKNPFFIEGGGHGNIGTEAYVRCYREIKAQEDRMGVFFDYIFFASGTGTTQAGLVSGQLMYDDNRTIVGISIARKNPRGRNIVVDSIMSYLGESVSEDRVQSATLFIDDYTEGYGKNNIKIENTIKSVLIEYGIPLDATYTGKAFMGMRSFIEENKISNKNILFIHTGGTPLFFDTLRR